MKKILFVLIGLTMSLAPVNMAIEKLGAGPVLSTLLVIGWVLAVAFMPKINILPGVVKNGVEVEVWSDFIASNLFKGIEFILRSVDASGNVLVGKVVHIPQAGTKPTVVKNRSSLPAVAVKRTDTDVTYSLDEYTTDPVIIEDAANVQLSYDKMNDVLGDHIGVLNDIIADSLLLQWAPAALSRMLRSTGTAVGSYMPASTGNRKAYQASDLKAAFVLMNKLKIPKKGRVALMSEDAWSQIELSLTATNSKDFSSYLDAKEGVIGRLYGFDIYTTPTTVVYDNAATPVIKAYGAAGAATDNDAILCWHERFVERAVGEKKFFEDEGSALYYGDLYSGLVRAGGRKRYNDESGVVAIIQIP